MSAYHRQKGSTFERATADFLATEIDDRIDRRVKTGAKDKGDIAGVRHPATGARIVIEAKNTSRINLGVWAAEAEQERINDGAIAGIIAHKRHGKGKPQDQWVTMTMADFVAILTGTRPISTTPSTAGENS